MPKFIIFGVNFSSFLKKTLFFSFLCTVSALNLSCDMKLLPTSVPTHLGSGKAMLSYSLKGPYESTSTLGTITGQMIFVNMPYTNPAKLVATFTESPEATVTVGGTPQISGVTENDFTNPVVYTVTAQDGTSITFTVTVTVAAGHLYVANFASNKVAMFDVSPSTGFLTPLNVAGSNLVNTGGTSPYNILINPSKSYVYVSNNITHDISKYAVNAAGGLTLAGIAATVPHINTGTLTIDPTGKYLFVGSGTSHTITSYSIDSSGNLTLVATTAAGAGGLNKPFTIIMDSTGSTLYAANYISSGSVSKFSVTSGVLNNNLGPAVLSGAYANYLTINTSGTNVYAVNADGGNPSVSTFTRDNTGALALLGSTPTGLGPYSMTLDPADQYAYVANYDAHNVSMYRVGTNGLLTANESSPGVNTIAIGGADLPNYIIADPTGRFIYTANSGSDTLSVFSINENTGLLTPLSSARVSLPGGSTPYSLTFN